MTDSSLLASHIPDFVCFKDSKDLLVHSNTQEQSADCADTEEKVKQIPEHAQSTNGTDNRKCAAQQPVRNGISIFKFRALRHILP